MTQQEMVEVFAQAGLLAADAAGLVGQAQRSLDGLHTLLAPIGHAVTRLRPATVRSGSWPAHRAAWLKEHGTCAACGGTTFLEVHHVVPVSWPGGDVLELDPTNYITLCERPGQPCHLLVGHLGDWHARNPTVRPDAAWWLEKRRQRSYPS